MRLPLLRLFFLGILLALSLPSFGLSRVDTSRHFLKRYLPPQKLSLLPADSSEEKRAGSFLVLPVLSVSPETSLRFGPLFVYLFRFKGSKPGTQLSTLKSPFNYTLKNQVKIRFSYEIFTSGNNQVFFGATEWIRFPLLFWGIGDDTPESAEEIYTTSTISFLANYLGRVTNHFYLGGRIDIAGRNIVEIEDEGLLSIEDPERSILGRIGGFTAGIGLVTRIDKRDNIFNAATGPFLEASISTYRKAWGSDFQFVKITADFRHFVPIIQKRHVLAFHVVTERNWGNPSFETLALLGGDDIMRGHYEGRFRDKALWAAQVEYRLPLFRKDWFDESPKLPFWDRWGMAMFAGLGSVGPDWSQLRNSDIKSSLGVGIRYLARPAERANIRVDFGFGSQKPSFYFNIREAF